MSSLKTEIDTDVAQGGRRDISQGTWHNLGWRVTAQRWEST